jgi:glycerol-3-phosphate dehydrogenase (NAD(P)+)
VGIGIAAFALFVAFALANMHRVEFSWLLGRSEILEVAGETTGGVPLIVLLGAAFVLGIILGWALTSMRALGPGAAAVDAPHGPFDRTAVPTAISCSVPDGCRPSESRHVGKVAVMGAGSWGTAFAVMCHDAGGDTVLWARRPEVADEITTTHRNESYLPGIDLPDGIRATVDPAEALAGADVVVVAVPSIGVEAQLGEWGGHVPADVPIVSLIKGVDVATLRFGSQVIRDALDCDPDRVVVVSGPNLAKECAQRLPAATVAASPDLSAAERVQEAVMAPYFRVYTNPDKVGVEIGGAVKNVIALAAGIAEGMGFGDNTKAAVITRGLAEMQRLGVALGGDALTFSGLAGVGDLVATCTSPKSRNRTVGERLGRGRVPAGHHRPHADGRGRREVIPGHRAARPGQRRGDAHRRGRRVGHPRRHGPAPGPDRPAVAQRQAGDLRPVRLTAGRPTAGGPLSDWGGAGVGGASGGSPRGSVRSFRIARSDWMAAGS